MKNLFQTLVNKISRFIFYKAAGYIALLYFKLLLKGKVYGIENIPEGPSVLAFNHLSYLDWCIAQPLFRFKHKKKIHFLAKKKLISKWFWRNSMKHSDSIFIDYSEVKSIRQSYLKIQEFLQKGEIVGIFPEGTRSPDGKIHPAKEGIANIIFYANVPIVPVGLSGFYEAWPRHKKFPGIAKCTINIGQPICFNEKDFSNRKEAKRMVTNRIMKEIALLSNSELVSKGKAEL